MLRLQRTGMLMWEEILICTLHPPEVSYNLYE